MNPLSKSINKTKNFIITIINEWIKINKYIILFIKKNFIII